MERHLTFVREPRKIPVILSPQEIGRLLEAAPGPKYKAAMSAAYSAGLRVSEVVALKVADCRFQSAAAIPTAGSFLDGFPTPARCTRPVSHGRTSETLYRHVDL